ncbi:MAG TPA: hypothetical protein ENK23_05715 [Sorangium sp.]|nr:hypothetical protein [Sorangium sp.]
MTKPSKPPSPGATSAGPTTPIARTSAATGHGRAPTGSAHRGSAHTDQMVVFGRNATDDSLHVLRQRNQRLELGKLHALRQGRPINGEVVRLSRHADNSPVYDVDVLLKAPATATGKGPARVNSMPFRTGWDVIFGGGDAASTVAEAACDHHHDSRQPPDPNKLN